jgi:subtilisin family serine protease
MTRRHDSPVHAVRSRLAARGVLAIGLALAGSLVPGASAAPGKDGKPRPPQVDPARILVKFASPAAETNALSAEGDTAAEKTGNGVAIVRLRSGANVDAKVHAYSARPGVVYAEPDYIRTIDLAPPNDPSFGLQWGPSAINAPSGWSIYPGSYSPGAGVKIAIVDTGIHLTHPDLTANLDTVDQANCVSGSCSGAVSAQDDQGHGTHVGGIAAAVTNNGVGVAGVAFNSQLIPVKVLASNGSGDDAGVASGIVWAKNHGARVINLSLGGYGYSQTLCDAVSSATTAGALVVAAAGNDAVSTPLYPAACTGAIGVAATDSSGGRAGFSNFGSPDVFVSAPGVSIYSTMWSGTNFSGCHLQAYCYLSGTSMATPHVSGLAALLFREAPTRTPTDVRRLLAQTAQKIGAVTYGADPYGTCSGCTWHEWFGYGEIDVQAALAQRHAAATLSLFAPFVASTGSTVTLTGSGFVDVSSVTLGGVATSFSVDSPTQITATVPAGVGYGRWRVTTPTGAAASQLVFTATPPVIDSFSPASGATGSTVTISGSGFLNVSRVTLGNVDASFTVNSPTQITATVPAGVEYGRWRVITPLWTAADPIVHTAASGTSPPFTFSPSVASTGSTVTLTGTSFVNVSTVTLGGVATSFSVDSPTQITATVPAGVGYGRWRVTTPTGTAASQLVFTATPPVIDSFSPASGATGSTVTISGSGFLNVSRVTLGNVDASFTVNSPTQISATVPAGVEYGRWRVITPLWTAADPIVRTVTG